MKSKNIIILLPFFTLGGAETQALHIAKGFKNEGNEVTVVAFGKKNGKLIKSLELNNINWKLAPFDLNLVHQKGVTKFLELLKFGFFVRKLKPDLLFPFTYYPNILTSAIWRITGARKCFWNQRGLEIVSLNFIEKLAVKSKPNYISNSITGAKFIANKHHIDTLKVKVISNGIDPLTPTNDKSYWRDRLGLSIDEKLYVQVANFYPEKNHLYLIKAWSVFMKQNPMFKGKLVFVGYAPNNEHINAAKAMVFDLKIHNIQFSESTNDVSGLLQCADVGILTSSSEGCPNIVLEYMYARIPTVVSDIDATVEILSKDYPFFCDLKDENSLVKVFNIINTNTSSGIVEDNYKLVTEKYSIDKLQKQYNSLLS